MVNLELMAHGGPGGHSHYCWLERCMVTTDKRKILDSSVQRC